MYTKSSRCICYLPYGVIAASFPQFYFQFIVIAALKSQPAACIGELTGVSTSDDNVETASQDEREAVCRFPEPESTKCDAADFHDEAILAPGDNLNRFQWVSYDIQNDLKQ